MPHCFQSEHMFYIKRELVVGVGGAEGRFKGSSALKDLNLFKVSTLRALTTFHPTQERHFCPHSHVPAWGLGSGPGWRKETGWSPHCRYFPQGTSFFLWDLTASLRHIHQQRKGGICLLGRLYQAMGGDGYHEVTWEVASSFYLGSQTGGCWLQPESGTTAD